MAVFKSKAVGEPVLVTTTSFVEGVPIAEHFGMVASQAILGANVVVDLLANIRDFIGGRSRSYERVLRRAREEALASLVEEARQLGANAVIGVDLDYNAIGPNGQMLMVSVAGTAVRLGAGPGRAGPPGANEPFSTPTSGT